MKRNGATPAAIGRVWSLAIALMLMLSALPVLTTPAAAQGTVSLTITTTAEDGVTPMPFVRVRATTSDGTVYGPREIGLQGATSFDIDVTSAEMTVTVDVETTTACGVTPDPQVIGPFAGGETPVVNFAIGTDGNCSLGTLAVYAYDCPSGFDSAATAYETWRDGCTEDRNNVPFTFTMVSSGQTWNPVTGQWGISARAPIVGLPPGAYTLQETNPASGQTSVFYCYNYATPDYVTSPNPTSIDRVDAPGGVATVNLNNNRISCDVFQVDAPSEPDAEPTATEDSGSGTINPPANPIGQATTTTDLNLRSGPSSDAEVLVLMPTGAVVDILGEEQNGFLPVRYQGQDGWAGAQFLDLGGQSAPTATTEAPIIPAEPTATNTVQAVSPILPTDPIGSATTTSDVNMRDAPTTDGSNVIAVIPGGTVVELLGEEDNGFLPVRVNDQSGWISAEFLEIDGEGGETATVTPTATTEIPATSTAVSVPNPETPLGQAVTNDSVNFRNGPSSEAAVLFELPAGATVDLLGDALNGFFPVDYQGQTGWVSEIFLDIATPTATATTEAPATATSTITPIGIAFTTSDVNMRTAPDQTSEVLTVLLPNTQVDLLGPEVNGFLPIRYNGQDGYASAQFMSIGQPATATATATESTGAASEDPATIELHKSVCPAGYVPGDSIYDDCHANGLDNIEFTVNGPNDFTTSGTTSRVGGVGPGIVVFDELAAPATYTIFEDVPGDFTSIYVYCSMADSDEVVLFDYNDAVQGIDIALASGQSVICDWYNIPDDQGTGSIELHKALCDPGYVPGPGVADECHGQGLAGVTFTINGPNNFTEQGNTIITQSPGPGIVTFDGLFAGTFTLTENYIGEGIGISVFCSMADSDEIVPFDYTDNGGIEVDLDPGQQIICDWYNTQEADEDTGTVIVHKRTCPVGYDHNAADFDDFYADCITRTDDITFTLTPQNGAPVTRDTGDDGNGRAVFTGLGAGSYALGEDLPGEFVTRYAYCGPDDRNLSATPVVNGNVQLQLTAENPNAVCLWFNSPEDLSGETGQISLTKYVCPAGTTSNYWQKCSPTPLQGATFHLNGPGENDGSAVTPANGTVVFGDLPAGNYTIQEVPPAGVNVAVYVVACQAGGAAYKFTYDDSNGMKIKLNLPIGGEVHCNWYNVRKTTPIEPPPVSGGKGTITVHKFLCTGKAVSQYDWENDCLVQTSPEGFALANVSGTRLAQGTTSANGIITFTGLANGTYKLDETTGDWCHAEADYVDAAGNVIVKNGGNTNVYIYNCGARQVGTLPVTGSGDTALGNATANLFMPATGALATLIVLGMLTAMRRKPARSIA
jgi:uncharacterized protein YraI